MYGISYMFRHYIPQGEFLVPSERCSIEEQSIEYGRDVFSDVVRTHHVTKHNTPIHNILSTAPQLASLRRH
jgi:hypothetical protein